MPLEAPRTVLDLGCGTGNVAKLLAQRWPSARITGVDSSADMLARAREAVPGAEWVEADLSRWEPAQPADLVFSNAALHWLDDHAARFPRLAAWVAPGGCLAVQMPASFDQPSHRTAYALAAEEPWRRHFPDLRPFAGVHGLRDYHGWLSPAARRLDLWETTYLHLLEGEDPITEWFKGSLLVPFLEALPAELHEPFLTAYRARVQVAYPKDAQGRTPMLFRRIFLIAMY